MPTAVSACTIATRAAEAVFIKFVQRESARNRASSTMASGVNSRRRIDGGGTSVTPRVESAVSALPPALEAAR